MEEDFRIVLTEFADQDIGTKTQKVNEIAKMKLEEQREKYEKEIEALKAKEVNPIDLTVDTVTGLLKKQNEIFNNKLDVYMNKIIKSSKKDINTQEWI